MNRNDLKYFFHEGLHSVFSHGFMSVASLGITVACLLVMGTFSLISYNVTVNVKDLLDENVVLAFVDEDLDLIQAKELKEDVDALENVKDSTFVTKQEARDSFVEQYDSDDLYNDLDADVFRHRYVIHLKNINDLDRTITVLEQIDGIAKVRADVTLSQGFSTLKSAVTIVGVSMIGILFLVTLFIIANSIKMTFYDRREEIAIMRIVGATKHFIRWPFVFEGFILGTVGGLIAFFFQSMIYNAMVQGIQATDSLGILSLVDYNQLFVAVLFLFLLAGILIGVLGSIWAVRRYVKV